MEHKWKIHYVVKYPFFVRDYTTVSAESKQEALDKVGKGLDSRCTLSSDWHFDTELEPELIC